MCLIDSSTSIDIDSGDIGDQYICTNCETKFRGLGKKVNYYPLKGVACKQ